MASKQISSRSKEPVVPAGYCLRKAHPDSKELECRKATFCLVQLRRHGAALALLFAPDRSGQRGRCGNHGQHCEPLLL